MNESKFTRGAWLTLAFGVLLFVWGVGGMLYLIVLPTDGWRTKPPDTFGESGFIYVENVMGAASGLQPDDHLVAIEGIRLGESFDNLFPLNAQWQAGNTMHYTVERKGKLLELQVPLVQWQFRAALNLLFPPRDLMWMVGVLLFFAIAAFTFFKRPNDHAARALLTYATLFVTFTSLVQTLIASPNVKVFPFAMYLNIVTIFAAYSVLFPPTLLQFALVFPRPKPAMQRHPWLEYLPYLVGLCILPFFFLEIFVVGYAWTIFSIVGAIVILIHSAFTMRDALSRAQLLWGLWGFVLGMVMFLSTYLITFGIVSGIWAEVVNIIVSLSFSVLGITLATAILRYRLFDIGIIIRRTLTYALVTALLLGIFFGSVILLQLVFAQIFPDLAKSEIVTVLSTLGIAALFVPLRNRIQLLIDQRFNRKKYDAQKVLEKFGETVRDETDLGKLSAELLNVVNETMQPKSVSLWLKQEKGKGLQ